KAKIAVPPLLDVFPQSKGRHRVNVLAALFAIEPEGDGAQKALLAALKDVPDPKKDAPTPQEWREKYVALINAIGICESQGRKAWAALPFLVELHANTKDESIREAVFEALQMVDPDTAKKLRPR